MDPTTIGPNCVEGQGFGLNFNPSYHEALLLGHTGIDVNCGWGSPIAALCAGYVYFTYPINQPAADGYTAVFTIVETLLETFEMSYGHVSEIDCLIGQQVAVGDIIAKEGNHGIVYAGNTLITVPMQRAGDHDGHHRHYQKRVLKEVIRTTPGKTYLQTSTGIYYDGFYYEYYDNYNGFNSCVDWTLPLFNRDLYIGRTGYDVYLLQKALVRQGFATFAPTGNYGPLTIAALSKFQLHYNLTPTAGYCGPKTRAVLNKTYYQLQ
jgi:hypothetical protein